MRCGFCNREMPARTDPHRERCGACPGHCRKVHCPYCGYANPVPSGFLRRWLEKDPKSKDEE